MVQLPQKPIGNVRTELKGKVAPGVRTRLSAIYNYARQGKSPTQIVAALGLSQGEIQDVARAVQALGLEVAAKHQFADLAKVREQMEAKRVKP